MFTKLRARLVLSHLTVIVLAMGMSGLLLLTFFEQYFLQATENSLIAQARITAQALVPDSETITADSLQQSALSNIVQQSTDSNLYVQSATQSDRSGNRSQSIVQLGAQLTTRIRIINIDGMVLLDSQEQDVGQLFSNPGEIQQALTDGLSSAVNDGEMTVAFPVVRDGEPAAIVFLSQPLNDVLAVLNDLRWRWGLATGTGLVLSAIAGLFLSQRIVNPLLRLTTAVERVAQGNLEQKVMLNRRDEIGRLSSAFNDMTDSLRRARQVQIDFVANVSHELRTPLTAVKTMTETLRAGAADDLSVRDSFLETVETEADRLIRMVNDLLLLSRADSRELNLNIQPIYLSDFLSARLKPFIAQEPSRIVVDVAPDIAVAADNDRLAQVIVNLLDNAVKYSARDSAIRVSAHAIAEKRIQVSIRDEGIGIALDELPRIGQRFYRTDKARTRADGGAGLGLAIASAIIAAHGGSLRLESRIGHGTTVHFTLPAAI
jgi:signal transduction histidine kinase